MKFRDDVPEAGGGGQFLKLKDKESVYGVFLGELYEFFTVWKDGKSQVASETTPKSAFRFRINFVVKEGNEYVAKIFENGATVYHDMKGLHEEYDLEKIVVKMTRNGAGLDTTYSLVPILKIPVSAEVKKVALQALEHNEPPAKKSDGTPMPTADDEIPF